MKKILFQKTLVVALIFYLDTSHAVDFEKLGSAIGKSLGSQKVSKTQATVAGKPVEVYYSKGADGKAAKFAVVQKRIYDPNCTHTWVVGLDSKATVEGIRVVEMKCPHAFPCKENSYLEQYTGKGPAQVKSLADSVSTIAKATGTSQLTTEAVVTAIEAVNSLKGKI